jgi:dihydroneopterin aldolase
MIEHAAYLAAGVCLEDAKVRSVRVKVTKSGAVKNLRSASVSIERHK